MLRVKICGITKLEDALCAIEYGADAIGFVFYKKSSRYIGQVACSKIVQKLPPFIERVGVFVDESEEEIDEICSFCGLSLAQVYPQKVEPKNIKTKTLATHRVKSAADIKQGSGSFRLVDAFVEEWGGEGRRLNLEWFEGSDYQHIVLAGGINEYNIDEIKEYPFYGVDVSSGVEVDKGVKDRELIKRFLQKAKSI